MNRQSFVREHPHLFLLDQADPGGLVRYLATRGLLTHGETLLELSKAGDGNMNCTLRATTTQRRLIVKQARPWVEKYDHIPAPWDRSLVEAAFYRAVERCPGLSGHMPRLIDADADARVLVLEDIGLHGDFTSLYAAATLTASECSALAAYLQGLRRCTVSADDRAAFANRAMRALNHEHIFRFPLCEANGLALDEITPGLQTVADVLKQDRPYVERVAVLGECYLADGDTLVHGDYFPGSWLHTADGRVAVIDPEFCFLGAAEFDVGVMLAHLLIAGQAEEHQERVLGDADGLDRSLVRQFAGVEIMRRLIGVAQLPLRMSLDQTRALLARSRALVIDS